MQKAIALFSGGIDSPVAAWLAFEKGFQVTLLYFDNRPFSSEENLECVKKVYARLLEKAPGLKALVAPHGQDVAEFLRACSPRNTCLHSKRHMHRVAEIIARKTGASAIVTGDLMGSKASQTAQNLSIVQQACSLPVLRPLLCLEKEEIEKIARQIGTLELASLHPQCTATPGKPSTRAKLKEILADEAKLDVNAMAEKAASEAEPLVV